MYSFAQIVAASRPLFGLLAFVTCLLGVCTCLFASSVILKALPSRRLFPVIFTVLMCAVTAAARVGAGGQTDGALYYISTCLLFLLNFICVFAFYPGKKCLKPFLIVIGLVFADALKYLLLMFLSLDHSGLDTLELLAELLVGIVLFAVFLGLYIYKSRRYDNDIPESKLDIPLYLLILVTTSVFILTLIRFGLNYSESTRSVFLLAILNIPLVGGTVLYSVSRLLKAKLSEENYRHRLDMQLDYFDRMEKKNEELRVFRHDFTKKLRPAVMYLSDGKNAEALDILSQFTNEIEASRPRYNTGNFMLDTVLECEQQLAEKAGARVVLAPGSVFPAEGIEPDDIYTIFPNALDNAIEACSKVTGDREITFSSRVSGDTVYVSVKNPCAEKVEKNTTLETSKKDKNLHGYGLKSIKKAAAKYGSENVEYFTKDGQFNLRIVLQYNN